ncbi:MAG: ABC transporter ATP-binding protein [Desulfobacterales bacterium]|nr:ABC transporter ATP-binding protein [Desulfobacterales bacterium]
MIRMICTENLTVKLPRFSLLNIDLTVEENQFFVLLGPTGAGKTVLLETIAGLLRATGGRIHINGRDATRLPPEKRGVGIVYQDSALFPHLNVRDNIEFGARYRKLDVHLVRKRFESLVDSLGLEHHLDRSVTHLSGGERQRVALARALVVAPKVLLLDEPMSALDPNFREEIRDILKRLHQETGVTVLMVTHDFSEARYLARRIAIIHEGRLVQSGGAGEIFQRPATPFVARFVGMDNLFKAVFKGNRAIVGENTLTLSKSVNPPREWVAFRPENVKLYRECAAENVINPMMGVVRSILHQGVFSEVWVCWEGLDFKVLAPSSRVVAMGLAPEDRVMCGVAPESLHVI